MALLPFTLLLLTGCCGVFAEAEKSFVVGKDFQIKISEEGKVHFSLPNTKNGRVLSGRLGISLPKDAIGSISSCGNGENCLQFGPDIQLTVEKKGACTHLNWTTIQNYTLEDCVNYEGVNWYGGPEHTQQYWPFNNMTFNQYSYITKEEGAQAVAEPYWVSESGFYIYVDTSVPLFIDCNHDLPQTLCLVAMRAPPYLDRGRTTLAYKMCGYKNTKQAHMHAVKTDLGKPSDIPDERMIQHPIWSTWVRDKYDVNDSDVRAFAQEIIDNGFNNSQLEIDDNWETCYGSGRFNKSRFPNMKKLATDLEAMGFRITLWNHPFVNINCPLFKTLESKGFLVKDQNAKVVSVWWDGIAGVIDFTNPDAAAWYLEQRRTLMKNNKIDSVKMDAGESSWLPQIPQLTADLDDQPNAFTKAYASTVAQFNNMVEVRSGHHTQNLPIFMRMLDKDSKWTFDNGLPTLITTLFQLNLNGYTLVLPDMVGGNAYEGDVVTKELFIRWLQANVFMPSIQFSASPWDFDNETVEISKKFTALHYEYSSVIIEQIKKCVKSGVPVNTPIWWVAPTDKVAHSIWSEFMLGEDILVAPVVEKGAVTRDIYLPKGRWRDMANPDQPVLDGGIWLKNYSAPLDTLPFFTRVKK